MSRIRQDIHFEPISFGLLEKKFGIGDLQRLYESILGVHFDRRNFHKKMMQTGVLREVEDESGASDKMADLAERCGVMGRKRKLFCFDEESYNHMKESGSFRLEF